MPASGSHQGNGQTGTGAVTASMEQYLLAMYCLRREGQPVIGARLAEWLAVSPASVTGMLQRMGKEGLVGPGHGKEVGFTPRGWSSATRTARRHYLAERLLADVLGVPWARVHREAERWRHSISDETEERLWETLGRPTVCPHGSPIPGTGACFSPHTRRLPDAAPGERLTVERISDRAVENAELLEYFEAHDLVPGRTIEVVEASPVTGSLTLRTERAGVALGLEAARQVLVVPAGLHRHLPAPERLRRDTGFAVS